MFTEKLDNKLRNLEILNIILTIDNDLIYELSDKIWDEIHLNNQELFITISNILFNINDNIKYD
jgi:hypothetical protein